MIGLKGLGKQAAAVECVLAQHALAPTVDGRNGGLIHPLRGNVQAVRTAWPLLDAVLPAQVGDQAVGGRCFVAEEPGGLRQSGADTLAQLLGGRIGEGHHEDLRRQQFAAKTAELIAVPQHQAQIQRRNGEGLAGTGTGFDQLATTKREG
ncbi:hypothetical protein D3C84_330090 [compost metagenome]